jgi:hypothetical protein
LDRCIFAFEIQLFKNLSWCTHQPLNNSKWIKNEEDMGLEQERGIKIYFQNV